MSEFRDRLKMLRKENGIGQHEITGVPRNSVCQYEKPENRLPYHQNLITIAQFFNVSTDYLLGLSDQRKALMPKQKELSDYSTDELMCEVLRRWK